MEWRWECGHFDSTMSPFSSAGMVRYEGRTTMRTEYSLTAARICSRCWKIGRLTLVALLVQRSGNPETKMTIVNSDIENSRSKKLIEHSNAKSRIGTHANTHILQCGRNGVQSWLRIVRFMQRWSIAEETQRFKCWEELYGAVDPLRGERGDQNRTVHA